MIKIRVYQNDRKLGQFCTSYLFRAAADLRLHPCLDLEVYPGFPSVLKELALWRFSNRTLVIIDTFEYNNSFSQFHKKSRL